MSAPLFLKPQMSEKAYALSEARTYVFVVPKNSNSQSVSAAVAKQFSVSIESVRLTAGAAKSKRSYRKRGRTVESSTTGFRKAYVTLKEGESLPFFTSDDKDKKSKKESK